MPFEIRFSPHAREHLQALRKRDRQIIVDAIAVKLADEPAQAARNRKKLEDNRLAPWELRVGNFRVYYDVVSAENVVVVVAVGHKVHDKLFLGGKEFGRNRSSATMQLIGHQ